MSLNENLTNDIDEIRVPVSISKFLLKEDDILDEDLLYYDNLKKGTMLTKALISAIQQMDMVETVKVLRLKKIIDEENEENEKRKIEVIQKEEEKTENIEKMSDTEIKLGFTDEKTDKKIAEAIRNTINKIRGKDYQTNLENTAKEIEKSIQEQPTSQTQKIEIQKIINEISQSLVDTLSLQKILPIKNKTDVLSLSFSNKSTSNYFLDLVVSNQTLFVNSAKSIVLKFINSFGDDNGGIILSSLFQFSENEDYILSHSIFVMSMSILIAKELTKLAYEKTIQRNVTQQNSQSKVDTKFLKVISLKTFDLEELINIGIASIMHDVGLRKNFGTILPSFKFPKTSYSKIELHPSESSFFAQRINLDVKVQRAIYEHHEYMDGSGYPKGINKYLSKYSPIIAFAERFSELVLENPFISKPLPPALAINYILKNEIQKYDKDVLFAFIRSTSTYPIGSWVKLSNNMIGLVTNLSPKDKTKQIVKVISDDQFRKLPTPKIIDLSETNDVKITEILNPIDLSKKLGDLKTYYFD